MPPEAAGPGPGPSDADRDRFAAALGAHYAAGRLDIAELDRRLELVLSTPSLTEAAGTLGGLPVLDQSQRSAGRRRGRRHAEHATPEAGWVPTLERFRDPTTGRVMRVWIDALDAGRHYVPEPTEV